MRLRDGVEKLYILSSSSFNTKLLLFLKSKDLRDSFLLILLSTFKNSFDKTFLCCINFTILSI